MTFAGLPFDSKVFSQPCRLSSYPRRIGCVAESSVVRHDAEHVDVLALCSEIDRKFVPQRTVEIGISPWAMKCTEQSIRACFIDNGAKLANPIGKDVAAPLYPRVFVPVEYPVSRFCCRLIRQIRFRFSREPGETSLAKTGVRHDGNSTLPTGVAMVVVEPDAINLEFAQNFAKSVHTKSAVARMRRADALPTFWWGADLPVDTDRRRIGMVLHVVGDMHRVELGEYLYALFLEQGEPFCVKAAGSHEDGVHTVILKLAVLHQFDRNTTINAPNLNVWSRVLSGCTSHHCTQTHKGKWQNGRPCH